MNIKPLADRVLILPAPAEEKTIGGIIIPDTAKEKPLKGEVIAVGNGTKDEEMVLKVGDTVLYGKYAGTELEVEGDVYKRQADKVVELVKKDGKTYVVVNDYEKLRELFGELLAEIQRIKSTGDLAAAHDLVEAYAVKVDPTLHAEVLERYKKLNLAPYKGFVNPKYEAVTDAAGNITDVKVTYDEGYAEQMLRYSKDYSTLPSINN